MRFHTTKIEKQGMEGNQESINDHAKERNLLATLKGLIFDLISIEEDVATLDVANKSKCIATCKRVLLQHGKKVEDFKREIENIRKEYIKEKGIKSIH